MQRELMIKKLKNYLANSINQILPVGSRSVLFGVHQFAWHPWTVIRAWRYLYRHWPTFEETICIVCHDTPGYWGKPNMDGVEGRGHPERGADIAAELVYLWRELRQKPEEVCESGYLWAWNLTINHSSHYSAKHGRHPSMLHLADKASILFEWQWFYLLRARLSGEIDEYIANSPTATVCKHADKSVCWYLYYLSKVKQKVRSYEIYRYRNSRVVI